ncbi:MAG: hypothetical protein HC883_01710 [Bdellovibrionaceae bacterium]|nr:hypothetical protein [Pseudobdellovibrionaceae bacterium]
MVELSIYEVGKSSKYPDGIKYGLICKDLKAGGYVLLDNHHPKGPHVHIKRTRVSLRVRQRRPIDADFEMMVLKELGVKL